MAFRKELNKFIALHSTGLVRAVVVFMIVWFVSGLFLIDRIDPLLFIGLWLPVGAVVSMFCYKW